MQQEKKNNRGMAKADQETRGKVVGKGGKTVSQDRQHMSEIGRKGGRSSGGSRQQG